MYRQILADLAHARDWKVHLYDAKHVEAQAAGILTDRADEVLQGPRARLGPPWTKDHRIALAGDGRRRLATAESWRRMGLS
jgi:hypothetical protein